MQEGHFYDSRCQSPSFRAQNRGFCALLGSGTLVFGHFEHKIEVFVRFCPLEPSFSGFPSTKSGFMCASYWGCWPGCGKSGLWERNTERWELKSRIGKGRVTLWVHRMCCGKLNRRIWEEKSAQLWGLRAFTICFAAWATLRKGTTLQKGATLLPGPTCRGAVSRTCTGRRARWLGILPFRVCRRGLRCCGFSPLRGARILSCLSQGT